jgi:hypothetical protein
LASRSESHGEKHNERIRSFCGSGRRTVRYALPTADWDPVLPLDSPLDALDAVLEVGAVVGIGTYATALVLGDVRTATVGVGVGCALSVLGVRSLRAAAGAFYPGADRTST